MKKRAEDTGGAAMVAVLCIMAVFTALAFSILLTASVASASSIGALAGEKCRILSVSFSDVMDNTIRENGATENELQAYLHTAISGRGWSYYREGEAFHSNKEAASRNYKVTDEELPDGFTLEVSMYWSPAEEESINYDNQATFNNSELYVTVICSAGGQTSQTHACYYVSVHESSDGEGMEWRWDLVWRK